MPYSKPSEAPDHVPEDKKAQWIAVWNSSYEAAKKEGKDDEKAEAVAFAQANGVAAPKEKEEKVAKAASAALTFNRFIPLMKVDAVNRTVTGVLTDETPDKTGEICDYATSKPFYQAWSDAFVRATGGKSMGNVREMHKLIAAGKLVDLVYDDVAKRIIGTAKIVDDDAWKKCEEGVYTGFSHGGEYVEGMTKQEGKFKRYTAKPTEVSIVDNPCNPSAVFTYVKADGTTELRKFQNASTEEPKKEEPTEKVEDPQLKERPVTKEDPQPEGVVEGEKKDEKPQAEPTPTPAATPEKPVEKLDAPGSPVNPASTTELPPNPDEPKPEVPQPKPTPEEKKPPVSDSDAKLADAVNAIFVKVISKLTKAEPATVEVKFAELLTKAGQEPQTLKKGMGELASFARLILQLAWLKNATAFESKAENDNSPLPEALQESLEGLIETFLTMAHEETKELLEAAEKAGEPSNTPAQIEISCVPSPCCTDAPAPLFCAEDKVDLYKASEDNTCYCPCDACQIDRDCAKCDCYECSCENCTCKDQKEAAAKAAEPVSIYKASEDESDSKEPEEESEFDKASKGLSLFKASEE